MGTGLNQPSGNIVVDEIRDPSGARVVLLSRVWHRKIVVDHPEMRRLMVEVMHAIAAPDHIAVDPLRPERLRFYSHDTGASSWLVVVVSCEQTPARIVSAFANRKDPPEWSE